MSNAFDDLRAAVKGATDLAPTKAVEVIAQALEDASVHVLLVAVGDPIQSRLQVAITVNENDVTATAVAQVVTNLMRHLKVPDNTIAMTAGPAGAAVVRMIERYRERRIQQEQQVRQQRRNPPKWNPAKVRHQP